MSDANAQPAELAPGPPDAPARTARRSQRGRRRYRLFDENLIEKSPVTTLLAVSVLCILILFVAMAVVINGWSLQRMPAINADREPYSALGSLFQGLIGSSFALAGSIVAIYLAVLGLRVVREQERREQEQYIRTYLVEALLPINKIARSVSELTFAYIKLQHSPGAPEDAMTGEDAGTQVAEMNDAFIQAINSLAADLESMCLSPQSLHLWGCSNAEPGNYLPKLWRVYGSFTPCPNATSDPVRYAAYLKAAADRFKHASGGGQTAWEMRDKAIRVFIHLVQEKRGAKFDFDEVEFIGLGLSMWMSMGEGALFNFGLATLLDIVDAIPDEVELRRFVEQEFDISLGADVGNLFASRLRKFIRNSEPARLAEPRLLSVLEKWGGRVENLSLVMAQPTESDKDGGRSGPGGAPS